MTDGRAVIEVIGVYDADGGVVGELRYVIGHLVGRAECSLCDITHGRVRRKAGFDALADRLGVPLTVVHRNERADDLAAATGDALPCVVAGLTPASSACSEPTSCEPARATSRGSTGRSTPRWWRRGSRSTER